MIDKIAISNIAWDNSEEQDIASTLRELGVKFVEIAPTKLWEEPVLASEDEIERVKNFWNGYGIGIVAFQSMLFKRPDAQIFGDDSDETKQYLIKFVELAGKMGVSAMVFGSPKNRKKGEMDNDEADAKAVNFFRDIGAVAAKSNVNFCIEPNPTQYLCDYVTNASEGLQLVKKIDSQGIGLHLDMASMSLAGDDIASAIRQSQEYLKHFHISAPFLEQVEERKDVDYLSAAEALKSIGYSGYVSIEMRPGEIGTNAERVKKAVAFTQSLFSSV